MIPVSYPQSAFYRIGDPYIATVGVRWRKREGGKLQRIARRQSCVRVRCVCGNERAIELKAWLRRPPTRCLECHHEGLRERARKGRAA